MNDWPDQDHAHAPAEGGEWAAKDGDYYCPGCGSRYDTAGTCEGTPEAGHPAIAVEKVKAAKADAKTEGSSSSSSSSSGKP